MKYCIKCGKELLDESATCPGCGCPCGENQLSDKAGEEATVDVKKKHKAMLVVIIVASVVVAILLGLAGYIFLRPTPKVEIDDIKQYDAVSALFKFGYPDKMEQDEFQYSNVDICGIKTKRMSLYFDENTYALYLKFSSEDDRASFERKIRMSDDWESDYWSASDMSFSRCTYTNTEEKIEFSVYYYSDNYEDPFPDVENDYIFIQRIRK